MRRIIAAFRVSVDGFIEGPNGEVVVDTWEDAFDLVPQIDTCILGGGMYPGYERYWSAILANPAGVLLSPRRDVRTGIAAYLLAGQDSMRCDGARY